MKSSNNKKSPFIEATSQQTRFDPSVSSTQSSFSPSSHNPTRELDIKDISLSISSRNDKDISTGRQDKVILQEANLKLLPGIKYLLHGKNGIGKSTILKSLKERLIPGVPSNIVISLLQQKEEEEEEKEGHKGESSRQLSDVKQTTLSALELVVQSDEARTKALRRREGKFLLDE